ncbi:hypothetical protein LCGC14_1778970 [marine sediment metagenome]|uniref:Uncharacterized protein n=1 Tax=marine sediment metagenome TaxID=412755 RepID=A0A0F9JAW7_9ZZZZ
MNIYVIWSDWDGANITEFGITDEEYKKAQDFIVELKKSDNNTIVDKVIRGVEMDVEDVEVVAGVKLTVKKS